MEDLIILAQFINLLYLANLRLRLGRLCERDTDYLEALNVLKDKCLNSYFCEGLVVEMLEKTEKWKDRFRPPTKRTKESNKSISIWTTIFPNLLKLTEREKTLNENVMITYKRPQTIATLLTLLTTKN